MSDAPQVHDAEDEVGWVVGGFRRLGWGHADFAGGGRLNFQHVVGEFKFMSAGFEGRKVNVNVVVVAAVHQFGVDLLSLEVLLDGCLNGQAEFAVAFLILLSLSIHYRGTLFQYRKSGFKLPDFRLEFSIFSFTFGILRNNLSQLHGEGEALVKHTAPPRHDGVNE